MVNTFLICLIISIFIFVTFLAVSLIYNHKEFALTKKKIYDCKFHAFSPFQVFLTGVFVSTIIIFFPVYYLTYFFETSFITCVQSIFLSIHNTMRVFVLDGEFNVIKDAVIQTDSSLLISVYSVYSCFLFVLAPVLTASFVLSFFKATSNVIKYAFYPRADLYFMSELNEKSLALAQDIINNNTTNRRRLVVFADVFENDEENNYELILRAKRLGAICFRKDILEIDLKLWRKTIKNIEEPKSKREGIYRKIYFISDNENENLKQALIIAEKCNKNKSSCANGTQLYVFNSSDEGEVLLDTASESYYKQWLEQTKNDKKGELEIKKSLIENNVKIRRVVLPKNLAMHTMINHSIFNDALTFDDKSNYKEMNIAVVGLGKNGREFVKCILWLSEMIGYKLNLYVFDSSQENIDYFKCVIPEILKDNANEDEEQSVGQKNKNYNIEFFNIDVNNQKFYDKLLSVKRLTTVFVTLGNDELNVDVSMKIRMNFKRNINYIYNTNFNNKETSIITVLHSAIKTDTISKVKGLKTFDGSKYNIKFLGGIKTMYSIDFIEQTKLETLGFYCHKEWVNIEEKDKQWYDKMRSFECAEYYRRSSMAQGLHLFYKKQLKLLYPYDLSFDKTQIMEHRRWCTYLRTEGYIYLDKKYREAKDFIAKTHPTLDFDVELNAVDKKKDVQKIDIDKIVL